MRGIVFVLMALIMLSSCENSVAVSDEVQVECKRQGWDEEFPLYGDVESVRIEPYACTQEYGNVVNKGNIVDNIEVYTFNKEGNVSEYCNYNTDGTISNRIVNIYDANGKITESLQYFFRGNNEETNQVRVVYTYDANGRLLEECTYEFDTMCHKLSYSYDAKGNRESVKEWTGTAICGICKYVYNAQGMVEEQQYYEDGNLDEKIVFVYDDKGNCIEEATYDGNRQKGKLAYQYDVHGNVIATERISADGHIYAHSKYEYDSNNNLVTETWYEDGVPFRLEKYHILYR